MNIPTLVDNLHAALIEKHVPKQRTSKTHVSLHVTPPDLAHMEKAGKSGGKEIILCY